MDLKRARKLAGIELTRPGLHENVADTIVQQMGGFGRLKAMLGAKVMKLADGSGIGIRWPNKERSRGNYVEVRLEPSDTYTMEFFSVSGVSKRSVKKYDDVYFDSLVDIFEKQTGWFLSLGGSKKPAGSGRPAEPELPPTGTKHEGRKFDINILFDPPVPDYKVGDIVTQHLGGNETRDVVVTDREDNVKNGRPGFGGHVVGKPTQTVWGYDSQIRRVKKGKHESKLNELRALLSED